MGLAASRANARERTRRGLPLVKAQADPASPRSPQASRIKEDSTHTSSSRWHSSQANWLDLPGPPTPPSPLRLALACLPCPQNSTARPEGFDLEEADICLFFEIHALPRRDLAPGAGAVAVRRRQCGVRGRRPHQPRPARPLDRARTLLLLRLHLPFIGSRGLRASGCPPRGRPFASSPQSSTASRCA